MRLFRVMICGFVLLAGVGQISADKLDSILGKHINAIGGKEKIASITSQSGYYTVQYMGISGKAEIHVSFPGKYKMKMNLGPLSQVIGCDGVTGWKEEGGLVTVMNPAEMRPIINAMFFASFSYIIPNRIPGTIDYRGTEDLAGTTFHVLACFPEGGDSVICKINDETGLMDYQISYEGGVEMLNHVLEYREVDGVHISWKESMIGRNTPIQATQTTDSVFLNPHLPESLFDMPGQKGDDFNFGDAADSIVIPVNVANNHIFIQVNVNGQGPFTFLLDSGAGKMVLAKSLAERLNISASGPIAMRGIGGFGSVTIGSVDSLNLGKLGLYINRTMITDLSKFQTFDAGELDGILGYDFFVRFPMTLDFVEETMTLYNPGRKYRPVFENTVESELYFQIPLITAELNGRASKMLFDLGAQTGLLLFGRSLIDETLRDDLVSDSLRMSIMGVGGISSVNVSSLDSIRIGREIIDNPQIIWSDNTSELPFSGYVEGIIGTGILGQYKVFVDYGAGKIGLDRVD